MKNITLIHTNPIHAAAAVACYKRLLYHVFFFFVILLSLIVIKNGRGRLWWHFAKAYYRYFSIDIILYVNIMRHATTTTTTTTVTKAKTYLR